MAGTAEAKFKMKGFSAAGQDICDAIESILNQPDDPTVKDGAFDTYDDEGLQSVRPYLLTYLLTYLLLFFFIEGSE